MPGTAIVVFVVTPGAERSGQIHVAHAQGLAAGTDERRTLEILRDWIEKRFAVLATAKDEALPG